MKVGLVCAEHGEQEPCTCFGGRRQMWTDEFERMLSPLEMASRNEPIRLAQELIVHFLHKRQD